MDKTLLFSIAALIVMVTAGAAIFSGLGTEGAEDVRILSITTDKTVYHSKETVEIAIKVTSPRTFGKILLRAEGIIDAFGKARLNEVLQFELQQGINEFKINYTLPVCSRCAGLSPGEYQFTVTILKEKVTLANATHSLSIA